MGERTSKDSLERQQQLLRKLENSNLDDVAKAVIIALIREVFK